MNKPWSCGAIFAGLVLLLLVLMAFGLIDTQQSNTTNTIIAAHNACEGQTGKPCD